MSTGYYGRQQPKQEPPHCRHCQKLFVFDDSIRSASGKRIPLDADTRQPHQCQSPNNPYNQKMQQQQQQQQQQPQQQQVTYQTGHVIAILQEIAERVDDTLTLVRALKPDNILTKEKEELLRENSELKEAIIKLQEFKPASQLQQQQQKTEESEFTT